MSSSRPVLAAATVLVEDGALLLVERGRPPEVGRWTIPGGKVEPGEGLRAAAERETLEETGLVVVAGPLVATAAVRDEVGGVGFLVADFLAYRVDQGLAPAPGGDAVAARFVTREGLASLLLVSGLRDWLELHGIFELLA